MVGDFKTLEPAKKKIEGEHPPFREDVNIRNKKRINEKQM